MPAATAADSGRGATAAAAPSAQKPARRAGDSREGRTRWEGASRRSAAACASSLRGQVEGGSANDAWTWYVGKHLIPCLPCASPLLEGSQVGPLPQHLLLPAVERRCRLLRAVEKQGGLSLKQSAGNLLVFPATTVPEHLPQPQGRCAGCAAAAGDAAARAAERQRRRRLGLQLLLLPLRCLMHHGHVVLLPGRPRCAAGSGAGQGRTAPPLGSEPGPVLPAWCCRSVLRIV